MRNPKLTSPLFGDNASGPIPGIGQIRARNGGFFMCLPNSGNPNPAKNTIEMQTMFTIARHCYSSITPTIPGGSSWHQKHRDPPWSTFWSDFVTGNPGFSYLLVSPSIVLDEGSLTGHCSGP
jgi:hypothetical protein